MDWQASEIDTLVVMRADGHSMGEMARALPGRNRNSVLGKIFRLRKARVIVDTLQTIFRFNVLNRYFKPQSVQDIIRDANHRVTRDGIDRRQALCTAWREAKQRAGDRIPDMPRSLASYVVHTGGIVPSIATQGLPAAYLNRSGMSAAEMAYGASDNGYDVSEACPEVLIDMLRDEAANVRHYSDHDMDLLILIDEYERARGEGYGECQTTYTQA